MPLAPRICEFSPRAGNRAVRARVGGGGLYVVSLSTVAKTYPERIRPRVMALLASMWKQTPTFAEARNVR